MPGSTGVYKCPGLPGEWFLINSLSCPERIPDIWAPVGHSPDKGKSSPEFRVPTLRKRLRQMRHSHENLIIFDSIPILSPHRYSVADLLKVLSSHSNWGVRLDSFNPMLNSRCPASFKIFFMIQSHERSIKQISAA